MLATFEAPTESVGPFGSSEDHLQFTVTQIKKRIAGWLYDKMNGVVQSGPFIGMKLPYDESWNDSSLGPQILGCYEQELHRYIEAEITRLEKLPHPKIVNIGCGGGYYAVGFACRVKQASVWIIDSDKMAEQIAIDAAAANGRILMSDRLLEDIMDCADFVFSDCEGAEIKYLDPDRFPSLARSTIICECHDYPEENNTQQLIDRFKITHTGIQVFTGSRNPSSFGFLHNWHQTTQWLAVDEGRPCSMGWLVMRPVSRLEEYRI